MEQNTKNFDRGIEQMMNEHEVAPPFGMWNRISSELEAMPAVAAAAPPAVTSLIPKRAMIGIIAAALVIGGSLLTGYLVNNQMHNNNAAVTATVKTSIATTTKPAATNTAATQQTVSVRNSVQPLTAAVTKVKSHPAIASSSPVQSTILAAKQVQPAINEPVAVTAANPVVVNNNTDVPTPIEPVAQNAGETQNYYFPPIDVTTPAKETTTTVAASKARIAELVPYNGDDNIKSEHKFKFHPGKKQKFRYSNINR